MAATIGGVGSTHSVVARHRTRPRFGPHGLFGLLAACGVDPPAADLAGPRVVASSLRPPVEVEVGVWPRLEMAFSEIMDPDSIHHGSVALVAWEETGVCQLDPSCERGTCQRGRCLLDPLSSGDLSRLDRGQFEGGEAVVPGVEFALDPDFGDRLEVRLPGPLQPRWRHSLVVGAGVRDRSGAPLVDADGLPARWRLDFVTAATGSSGPEARLVLPAHDQRRVPTNIGRIHTEVQVPVVFDRGAALTLEAREGPPVELVDPQPCPGWVPGTCVSWALRTELRPFTAYRPGGGSLVDRHGRSAIVPFSRTWFVTDSGPDRTPPDVSGVVARMEGWCVIVEGSFGEAVTVSISVGDRVATAVGVGRVVAALDLSARTDPVGTLLPVPVQVEDAAGNGATVEREVALGPAFDPDLGRIAIHEVLANPDGPEPNQEFVELVGVGRDAARMVELDGLYLADLPATEVRAALADGDRPGDAMPPVILPPGGIAVVVGSAYDPADDRDPAPAAGSILVRLDSSIADGGLKNAGEPLTLYRADPPVVISTYGDGGTETDAGQSVVRSRPEACDLPSAWRPHPEGRSTPGVLP